MPETKQVKWDGGIVVIKGKQSVSLFKAHQTELKPRMAEEEFNQHDANVTEFEKRLSGQSTNLATQKSSTSAQDQIAETINMRVISVRRTIKASNPTDEIKNAYGIGNKLSSTVGGASAAVAVTSAAYNKFKVWSNSAGILEKDITELNTLETSLYSADDSQEDTKYQRKAATMNKNTLQRNIEDKITKISSIGIQEFQLTNPELAKLFGGLIPSSAPKKKKPATPKKNNTGN
ncbi:MAG TPA: hypothetical protein VHO90_08210 [Bacteroidales bacterium]|nr:hypothetical protein [Bacteroidales bacterium]